MLKRAIGIGGAGIMSLLLLAGCLGEDPVGTASLRQGGGDSTVPEDSSIPGPNPDKDQVCTAIYREVCGTNGITYHLTNGCQKAPVPVAHEGACGNPRDDLDPIDDSDVVNIPDPIRDSGCVRPVDPVVPEDPWACIAVYDPVCGVDGKTYGNLCEARKTTVAHKGECVAPAPRECPAGMVCID